MSYALKAEATEIGGQFHQRVPMLKGERVLRNRFCLHSRGSPFMYAGRIYLTSNRLVWTPWRWTLPRTTPIVVGASEVRGVELTGRSLWLQYRWLVETEAERHTFCFYWRSPEITREWVKMVEEWAKSS
jgi:hypothetical protein